MNAGLIGLLALCLLQPTAPQTRPEPRAESRTGSITVHEGFESKHLSNRRRIWVYLPPGYADSARSRFPVLYMHDGQNVFDGMTSYIPNQEWRADETAEAMIRAGLLQPLIIVAIDNAQADRAQEFLPTPIRMGNATQGGKADLYGRFLVEEVKPFIDRTYRTRTGAGDTGLIGSSFGGVVTLHLGLRYPKVFGKLGVVSPSLWVDNEIMIRRTDLLPAKLPLKIWLDMGTREGLQSIVQSRKLRAALEKKGWQSGKDLLYLEESFGEHNEAAWARRLPLMLSFLFGK